LIQEIEKKLNFKVAHVYVDYFELEKLDNFISKMTNNKTNPTMIMVRGGAINDDEEPTIAADELFSKDVKEELKEFFNQFVDDTLLFRTGGIVQNERGREYHDFCTLPLIQQAAKLNQMKECLGFIRSYIKDARYITENRTKMDSIRFWLLKQAIGKVPVRTEKDYQIRRDDILANPDKYEAILFPLQTLCFFDTELETAAAATLQTFEEESKSKL
jgi:hypothetical protein